MGFLKGLAKFVGGGLLGAAIGAAVAGLFAPSSGPELQRHVHERIEEGKQARVDAQTRTERALRERFRQKVHDPNALEGERPGTPS